MKTAKPDEQMKRSIIDKRCAETALIEAETKLIQLNIENATKAQKTPTESIQIDNKINHKSMYDIEIETRQADLDKKQVDLKIAEEKLNAIQEGLVSREEIDRLTKYAEDRIKKEVETFRKTIETYKRKLKWNRFWFISIAGILSGILLFMILNYVH